MGKYLIKITRAGFPEAKAVGSKASGARKQQVRLLHLYIFSKNRT